MFLNNYSDITKIILYDKVPFLSEKIKLSPYDTTHVYRIIFDEAISMKFLKGYKVLESNEAIFFS